MEISVTEDERNSEALSGNRLLILIECFLVLYQKSLVPQKWKWSIDKLLYTGPNSFVLKLYCN